MKNVQTRLSQGGIFELGIERNVVYLHENKDVRYKVETEEKLEEGLGCKRMYNVFGGCLGQSVCLGKGCLEERRTMMLDKN